MGNINLKITPMKDYNFLFTQFLMKMLMKKKWNKEIYKEKKQFVQVCMELMIIKILK